MKEKTLITEKLGLFGWTSIEPVILASLASELPMLLIGKHGCAKSFILERLSEVLNLNYRFYNASLINYDDLVGIPIPIENNTKLDYISNENSIWDAEVVFIDEINRTKPELQNKLFPIIYDKRVQGINLSKLKYRWAAMNPSYINEDDEDDNPLQYIGACPLDQALADRFAYIIDVPSWEELSKKEKTKMLKDQFLGKHNLDFDIYTLINETKDMILSFKKNPNNEIINYIINLTDLLHAKFGYISSRRATILYETFISIYSSSLVLNKHLGLDDIDYTEVACTHILNTLPFIANMKVDKSSLINIALETIKISKLKSDIKDIYLISDPITKIRYLLNNLDKIDIKVITDIIPTTLSKIDILKRKTVSLALYLKLRNIKDIDTSLMETIINEIKDIFDTKNVKDMVELKYKKYSDKIDVLMAKLKESNKYYNYVGNILRSFLPDNYKSLEEISDLYNFTIKFLSEVDA